MNFKQSSGLSAYIDLSLSIEEPGSPVMESADIKST
jgi:hypothetical protein